VNIRETPARAPAQVSTKNLANENENE